jgi:hypothetical protein
LECDEEVGDRPILRHEDIERLLRQTSLAFSP